MKYWQKYISPIGELYIADNLSAITDISFHHPGSHAIFSFSPIGDMAIHQLDEYFAGTRKTFCLPLEYDGTEFQKSVWEALLNIPYGETRTYKDIAETVKNPSAFRAVGNANQVNPISIVIPCHRVISADGGIGGYGEGEEIKRYLLRLEGVDI